MFLRQDLLLDQSAHHFALLTSFVGLGEAGEELLKQHLAQGHFQWEKGGIVLDLLGFHLLYPLRRGLEKKRQHALRLRSQEQHPAVLMSDHVQFCVVA